jgi:hypothetical protein
MKYCFFLLLSLWLLNSQDARCQVENEKTSAINKICKQTDANKSLKKVVIKDRIAHLPVHGAHKRLTGFYKDSTLVKITLQGWDDNGKETFVYYYHHNYLIHVYNEFFGPHFADSGKRIPKAFESNFQGWYYFRQGKWIDEISTGHNRFENDELDAGTILPKEAKECRQMLP